MCSIPYVTVFFGVLLLNQNTRSHIISARIMDITNVEDLLTNWSEAKNNYYIAIP